MTSPSNARGTNKEAVIRCVYYLLALYERKCTISDLLRVTEEQNLKPVSRRTVQREMKALEGHFGVYRDEQNEERWCLDQTDFEYLLELEDGVALALAVAERHLNHIGPDHLLQPAQALFERAKRQLQGRDTPAAKWLQRVRVTPASHHLQMPQIDKRFHQRLLDAALRQVVLKLDYRSHHDEPPSQLCVTALSMFYRGNVPYLICRDHADHRVRQLPVSRLSDIRESIVTVPIIDGFDLDVYEQSGALAYRYGPPFRLELEVFQSVRREIEDAPLGEHQVLSPVEGRPELTRIEVTVPFTLNMVQWLLARSPYLKVLGPVDFKQGFYEELSRGMANAASAQVKVPDERSFS